MTTKLLITGALLAGLISFVYAQTDSGSPPAPPPSATPGVTGGGQEEPGMGAIRAPGEGTLQVGKDFDKQFLTCAIKNDIFQMKLGQTVNQKASNSEIKQFAQRMHDEHKQHLEQLKKTAQSKNWDAPEKADKWQQEYLDYITKLDALDLEQHYLFGQVACHYANVLANKFAANKAQDPEIRSLAMRDVPTLQEHLRMATRLTERVAGVQAPQMDVTGR
jgi:putative membrane protein